MPEMKLEEALKKAVELEERGYAFYTQCAQKTVNREGKSMFEFLASEEVNHANWIKDLLENTTIDKEETVDVPEMMELEEYIFQKKVPGGKADEKADALEALNIGVQTEKNSIELYGRLAEQCGNEEAKQLFRKLVGEEEKHLAILEKEVEFITETGEYHDFRTVTS